MDKHNNRDRTRLPAESAEILGLVFSLPWLQIVAYLLRIGRKLWRGLADEGMYEALTYESTLELLDVEGKEAHFRKRQRVRYLQDNIIAYQDQIWSDGEAPLDYRCSPGKVVDRYRPAQTTILLISLRERKARGDIDDYHIQWRIRGGFRRSQELWQTTIYYRTRSARIQVLFPPSRPPQLVWGSEEITQRRYRLPETALQHLPDGRWLVQWELRQPRRNERYNLHWHW